MTYRRPVGLLSSLVFVLAACGSTSAADTTSGSTAASGATSSASSSTSSDTSGSAGNGATTSAAGDSTSASSGSSNNTTSGSGSTATGTSTTGGLNSGSTTSGGRHHTTSTGASSGGAGVTTAGSTNGSTSGSTSSGSTSGATSGSTSGATSGSTSGLTSGSVDGGWWQPTSTTPTAFHWELSPASGTFVYPGDVITGQTIYDIDGQSPASIVADLHSQGFIVICYMEVGSVENDRPDYGAFLDAGVVGSKVQGWPGEYWVDITNPKVLSLIKARMVNWCQAGGFDAIEPDDSDVWDNNSGFSITQAQNDQYNIAVAQLGHSLGFSMGLKNNPDSAVTLAPYYDWALNEQCFQYDECTPFTQSFLAAGKAVWDVEYTTAGGGVPLTAGDCTNADSWQMNAMTRDLNLVGPNDNGYVYQPCIPVGQTTW